MSPTDNTPNFDNMTPEEIMAWMESLAKRQGATEGLTTAADLEIPEIDPTSVVIDEPGYVPYGQEDKMKKAAASPPPPPPVMAPPPPVAPPPPAVVAPIIQPAAQRPPAPPPVAPPPPVYTRPAAPPPPAYQRPLEMPPPPPPVAEAPLESAIGEDALSWLTSLAADQGVPDFNLDLSSLEPETMPPPPAPKSDPVSWLQGLADETIPTSPPVSSDPAAWLGSIATEAGMPVEDYELPAPLSLESPIAALDMFAVEAGFEDEAVRAVPEARQRPAEDMSIDGIELAIREGRVSVEQMKRYQELQMERAAAREDVVDEIFEDEAPATATDIPDWLRAMKPEEPEPVSQTGTLRPLESLFDSLAPVPEVTDVPDWLIDEGSDTENIEAIFAIGDISPSSSPVKPEIAVDQGDPWVAALDEEFQMGASEDEEPEWYRRNISDPARIAAVTGEVASIVDSDPAAAFLTPEEPIFVPPPAAQAEPVITITLPAQLADAALPAETSLPAGERQAVPEFMRITSTQTVPIAVEPEPLPVVAAAPQTEALPNWLVTDEQQPMLEWVTSAEAETIEPEPVEIIYSPPPPPVVAPVLPPLPASGSLIEARNRYQSGDVGGSIAIYELLVRASQSLTDVASDLATMARDKKDPVIYRVLGDSLMRQGRLQEALNTYRDALNLL